MPVGKTEKKIVHENGEKMNTRKEKPGTKVRRQAGGQHWAQNGHLP